MAGIVRGYEAHDLPAVQELFASGPHARPGPLSHRVFRSSPKFVVLVYADAGQIRGVITGCRNDPGACVPYAPFFLCGDWVVAEGDWAIAGVGLLRAVAAEAASQGCRFVNMTVRPSYVEAMSALSDVRFQPNCAAWRYEGADVPSSGSGEVGSATAAELPAVDQILDASWRRWEHWHGRWFHRTDEHRQLTAEVRRKQAGRGGPLDEILVFRRDGEVEAVLSWADPLFVYWMGTRRPERWAEASRALINEAMRRRRPEQPLAAHCVWKDSDAMEAFRAAGFRTEQIKFVREV